MKRIFLIFLGAFLLSCSHSKVTEGNGTAWREDFIQLQQILSQYYPNLEWDIDHRHLNLPELSKITLQEIEQTDSDQKSRNIFENFVAQFKDPHFRLEWPEMEKKNFRYSEFPDLNSSMAGHEVCTRMSGKQKSADFSFQLPSDFRPVAKDSPFHAGIIKTGKFRVGLIRIHAFGEDQYLDTCVSEWEAFRHDHPGKCDHNCWDNFATQLSNRILRRFAETVRILNKNRINGLIVDIAGNGGGTSWEEGVLAMVTDKQLVCGGSANFDSAQAKKCDRSQTWSDAGFRASCSVLLKSPSHPCTVSNNYYFERGLYSGPLFVLVDHKTASASEDFAARLQDNKAAIIIGETTLGAGCGYVNGGLDLRLKNSQGLVRIPNCVRYRLNGDNELSGVQPDFPLKKENYSGAEFVKAVMQLVRPKL